MVKFTIKRFLIFSVIFAFSGSLHAKQPKSNKASLQETLDFIEEKTNSYAAMASHGQEKIYFTTGCKGVKHSHRDGLDDNDVNYITNLDDIYEIKVEEMGSEVAVVRLHYVHNFDVLINDPLHHSILRSNRDYIVFTDVSIAHRVAIAFEHAIKLCKNSEPF